MARTKAGLGPGARLADFLSASLMARVVPPEVIHEVLDAHGRNSRRIRAFPAVAGVIEWFGFVTIPLLSVVAFLTIFALLIAAHFRSSK